MLRNISFTLFSFFIIGNLISQCSEIFISEYIEGSNNNKAIELYNPTNSPINLTGYELRRYSNGSTIAGVDKKLQLSGTIQAKQTYVLVIDRRDTNGTGQDTPISDSLWTKADTFVNPDYNVGNTMSFNGNDVLVLVKGGSILVDQIGVLGQDPTGGSWPNYDTIGGLTKDRTLIRKNSIQGGVTTVISISTDPSADFDPTIEWNYLPNNTFSNLGVHSCACAPCVNYSDTLFTSNSICAGDSLLFNNYYIKYPGKYYDSTTNGTCDSIIELNLISLEYRDTISMSICDSLISPSGNYTYTSTGIYNDTLLSVLGCDSVIVLDLTIGEVYNTTSNSICSGDSLLFGGEYIKNQGVYYDTTSLTGGCDSVIEMNLIINNDTNNNISSVICEGDSLFFAGSYLKTQGIYYDTLVSAGNCDSTIELNLIVGTIDTTVIYDTLAAGATYTSVPGYYYSTTGTYYETTVSHYSCDSVTELNLFFEQDSLCTATIQIDSIGTNYYRLSFKDSNISVFDTVQWEVSHGGSTNYFYDDSVLVNFIDSGIHTINMHYIVDIIGNSPFCVITDNIYMPSANTYCYIPSSTVYDTICGQYTTFAGNTFYTSGTHYDTVGINNPLDCDTILTYELIIKPNSFDTIATSSCQSQTYFSPSGKIYSVSGIYNDTIASNSGCDSIITINLTKLQVTASFNTYFVCDSFVSPSGKYTYYTTGLYEDTIPNSVGCDSLVGFDLTFVTKLYDTTTIQACIKYILPSGNDTLYSNGVYNDTLTSIFGCDSVLTINLTLGEIRNNTTATFCTGDSILFAGTYLTTPGIYYDTLISYEGCDSIIEFNLTNSTTGIIRDTIKDTNCYFIQSPSGTYYYTTGIYYDTILATVGCDSIYMLDYYLKQNNQNFIFDTACGNYRSPNGKVYTNSGAYEELYETQTNCYWDSLWLTIYPGTGSAYFYFQQSTPNVITLVDSSFGTDLTYIWSWGDGTYDSVLAAPSHTYSTHGLYEVCLGLTDTVNGCSYYHCDSLEIDSNGNMRSSFIINVTRYETVGINKNNYNNLIKIYPNPAKDQLWIESNEEMIRYKLFSIHGALIKESLISGKNSTIKVNDITNGHYLIGIETKNGTSYKKIAISK